MIPSLAPYTLDTLLQEAMDGALRTCSFWRLPDPTQCVLLAADDTSDLARWRTGNLRGASIATWEGVCRLLVCADYIAKDEEPEQLYRIVRARLEWEPFSGESMLDLLISGDAERHQDLLESVSGFRFPLDVNRLLSRQHEMLRSHFRLIPSRLDGF